MSRILDEVFGIPPSDPVVTTSRDPRLTSHTTSAAAAAADTTGAASSSSFTAAAAAGFTANQIFAVINGSKYIAINPKHHA